MEEIEKSFKKFYENIKLTQIQKEDAKTKYNGVCSKLHNYYYPNSTYSGNTKLLIGSYGKHTSIRPARDIDVIFIMPPEKFAQYDDNTSNKQSQLLQDIKKILEEKYPNTPISAYGKIVKLEFADTQHDVEVLPGWENEDGSFIIPDSENGGGWHRQDYRKEIREIADSDAITSKTKFLIRSIKKWSDNCTANIRTFQIERVVISFFSNNGIKNTSSAELFVNFFQFFLNNTTYQGLKSHITTALNRAQKALDFEINSKFEEAANEWKKVFGDDFPKTVKYKSYNLDSNLILLQNKYPSYKEEYIENYHDINLNPDYYVNIDTYVPQVNGFRQGWLTDLINNYQLFSLVKKMDLLFKIRKINVPPPYEIKWKVRNFGDEAKKADALRGEITPDIGLQEKKENTLYIGNHYVECYIIKDNKCVAIGHTPVPIG